LYETGIIYYRLGKAKECELRLKRALELNGHNPICHLSMAHLFIDQGRIEDAIEWLANMINSDILVSQALIMLGDMYLLKKMDAEALEIFTKALEFPELKKIAAERMLPILSAQGKHEEVKYLVKNCLKGCC